MKYKPVVDASLLWELSGQKQFKEYIFGKKNPSLIIKFFKLDEH